MLGRRMRLLCAVLLLAPVLAANPAHAASDPLSPRDFLPGCVRWRRALEAECWAPLISGEDAADGSDLANRCEALYENTDAFPLWHAAPRTESWRGLKRRWLREGLPDSHDGPPASQSGCTRDGCA